MLDQYIKMVLALDEEFFKEWEWKEGDMFLYKEDESEIYSIGYIGTHILSNTKPVGFMDICFDPFEHLMNLRPIPSQEQLQEMLITFHRTHNKFSRKRAILHIMGHWADYLMRKHNFEYDKIDRNQDYEYFGDPEDFDILMLRFTVGIILMLGWNGSSWEKMV